jgi:hypothetical protein
VVAFAISWRPKMVDAGFDRILRFYSSTYISHDDLGEGDGARRILKVL